MDAGNGSLQSDSILSPWTLVVGPDGETVLVPAEASESSPDAIDDRLSSTPPSTAKGQGSDIAPTSGTSTSAQLGSNSVQASSSPAATTETPTPSNTFLSLSPPLPSSSSDQVASAVAASTEESTPSNAMLSLSSPTPMSSTTSPTATSVEDVVSTTSPQIGTSQATSETLSGTATVSNTVYATSSTSAAPSPSQTTYSEPQSAAAMPQAAVGTAAFLGSAAGFVFLVWLVTWCCRNRRRRRMQELEHANLEDGYLFYGQGPSTSFGEDNRTPRPFPRVQVPGVAVLPDEPHSFNLHDHAFPLTKTLSDGPYPTARPLPAHLQGDDLAPNPKPSLKIANLTPADSSLYSSSRAGSRAGHSIMDIGTPHEDMASDNPRFSTLQDGGLDVPWPIHKQDHMGQLGPEGLGSVRSPCIPAHIPTTHAPPPTPYGWSAGFKTTVSGALSSFFTGAGGQSRSAFARPSQVTMQDSFTAPPRRRFSQASYDSSVANRRERALERMQSQKYTPPVLPFAKFAFDSPPLDCLNPFEDDSRIPRTPEKVVIKSLHSRSSRRVCGPLRRSSSVWSVSSFGSTISNSNHHDLHEKGIN